MNRVFRTLAVIVALALSGVLVAFVVIVWAEYSHSHPTPGRNALYVALFTAVTFYAVAQQFRRQWRRLDFWVSWFALLVGHVFLYSVTLRFTPEWPGVAFIFVAIAETPVLCLVLFKCGFKSPAPGRHRPAKQIKPPAPPSHGS